MADVPLESLTGAPIFEQLDEDDLEMLAATLKQRHLQEGDVLFEEGDVGDYLALLTEGKLVVEVAGDNSRTVVTTLYAPQVVGEMSCIDPAKRSATVRARGDVRLLVLEHVVLESLRQNAPGVYSRVVRGIASVVADRLDETTRRISTFLQVKREPTQPRQPSWEALQRNTTSGTPVQGNVPLTDEGVVEGLDDETRRVLRTAMEPRRFESGDVICLEKDSAREAYFIAAGNVEVVKTIGTKSYLLATVKRGGCLGQRALLKEGRHLVTLRAGKPDSLLLCLARDDFQALLEAHSSLAIDFQRAITVAGIRQLRQANDMVSYLGGREDRDDAPHGFTRVDEPIDQIIDDDIDSVDDIDELASMYLDLAVIRDGD